MPVLGSSVGTGSIVKRGVVIPAGSLDVWRAARALHASDRPEVVFLGDSTWWGEATTDAAFSPVARIRARAATDGYTDGGLGIVGVSDTAAQQGASLTPVQAGSAGPGGGQYSLMLAQGALLNTGSDITYQTTARGFRLWYAARGDSGSFTYSVNGGAPVTVTPPTDFTGHRSIVISGLPAGTNTLRLVWVSGNNAIDVEFINATGIVFHRHCVQGAQASSFITGDGAADNDSRKIMAILGASQSQGVPNDAGEGTHPADRKVRLAVWLLGVNDLNGVASGTAPRHAEAYENGIGLFCNLARAAGADPVVALPAWKVNQADTQYSKAGAKLSGIAAAVAAGNNAAFIDTNEALGGPYGRWLSTYYAPNGVHLRAAAYQRIGDWVYDNLITA